MKERSVERIIEGMPAEDGAGVKLKRILGTPDLDHLDPFLLLDEFKSANASDYIAGFPPHPHRGFETVTYLKAGNFRHRDSKGNEGSLSPGSVQWMTAGRGIIHSEMPEMKDGLLWGYQLWINLPSRLKMTEPRYQDIPAEKIPSVALDGANVKVIAGEFAGARGPSQTWFPVVYVDVAVSPGGALAVPIPSEMNCFIYLYAGSLLWAERSEPISSGRMIVAGSGEKIAVRAGFDGAGFILVAGNRIGEPVARAGPFVMNTREEIAQAFSDYRRGTLAG